MKTALVTLILVYYTSADPIAFNDCGSQYDLLDVDIHGCAAIPCPVPLGGQFNLTMKLVSSSISNSLSQSVSLSLFGLSTPADVIPSNPCSNLKCPIAGNNDITFTGAVQVPHDLVPALGMVKWTVTNNYGLEIVCMQTSIEYY